MSLYDESFDTWNGIYNSGCHFLGSFGQLSETKVDALTRSINLFWDHLTMEQRRELIESRDAENPHPFKQYFTVRGKSRRDYQIYLDSSYNLRAKVLRDDNGTRSEHYHKLCVCMRTMYLPDMWLGQKVYLEANDVEFIAKAPVLYMCDIEDLQEDVRKHYTARYQEEGVEFASALTSKGQTPELVASLLLVTCQKEVADKVLCVPKNPEAPMTIEDAASRFKFNTDWKVLS